MMLEEMTQEVKGGNGWKKELMRIKMKKIINK